MVDNPVADNPGFREDAAFVLSGGGALASYEVGVMTAVLTGETMATNYQVLDPGILTGTSAGALNAVLMISQLDNGVKAALDFLRNVWLNELAAPAAGGDNGVFRIRFSPVPIASSAFGTSPGHTPGVPDLLQPLRLFAGDSYALTKTIVQQSWNFLFATGSVGARAANFGDLAAVLSIEPLEATLRRILDPANIPQTRRAIRIAATNWVTGDCELFDNRKLAADTKYLAIRGSTAVPGVFPPVTDGDRTYVDGGLIMNTPLRPAVDAGANVIHAIYLDPRVQRIPTASYEGTLSVFQRSLAITFAANANKDIKGAGMINNGLQLAGQIRRGEHITQAMAPGANSPDDSMARMAAEVAGQLDQLSARVSRPPRPLTIHRYHPSDVLSDGLGILDFSNAAIQRLIDRGFEDGIRHDCAQSGCILP